VKVSSREEEEEEKKGQEHKPDRGVGEDPETEEAEQRAPAPQYPWKVKQQDGMAPPIQQVDTSALKQITYSTQRMLENAQRKEVNRIARQ